MFCGMLGLYGDGFSKHTDVHRIHCDMDCIHGDINRIFADIDCIYGDMNRKHIMTSRGYGAIDCG